MVALLKGLLGKNPRPIILDGELILFDLRYMLTAYLHNYRVVFKRAGFDEELDSDTVNTFLIQKATESAKKYALASNLEDPMAITARVDTFTGAVVLETAGFSALCADDLHNGDRQFTPQQRELLQRFTVDYTINYARTFMYLLNRRIVSPYMGVKVRGHFIAGFFQPLMVETDCIKSPLALASNRWLREMFANNEVVLETKYDTPRKLDLSCVATCDIADKFSAPILQNFDRKYFVFMILAALVNHIDPAENANLTNACPAVAAKIIGDNAMRDFFSRMLQYVERMHTGLSVR